jgi:hypothetical protein
MIAITTRIHLSFELIELLDKHIVVLLLPDC